MDILCPSQHNPCSAEHRVKRKPAVVIHTRLADGVIEDSPLLVVA